MKDCLRLAFSRVKAKDVLDLKGQEYYLQDVALSQSESKIYKNVEQDLIHDMQDGAITAANAMVKTLRLSQITSGIVPDDEGNFRKVNNAKKKR